MDQLVEELKTVLNKELEAISHGLNRMANKQENINTRLDKLKEDINNISNNSKCMFTVLLITIAICATLFIDALYMHFIHR